MFAVLLIIVLGSVVAAMCRWLNYRIAEKRP